MNANRLIPSILGICLGFYVFTDVYAGGGKRRSTVPRKFQRFEIPEAKCGDGSPYAVYLDEQNPHKLIVHMQGGGACWNYNSCYGPKPLTRNHENVNLNEGLLELENRDHSLGEYSYLYLPYCTGDFFIGRHKASYLNKEFIHNGYSNTQKVALWLETRQIKSKTEEVVVYGESAGALGIIVNSNLWAQLFSRSSKKTLVADSPGLHFPQSIWDRFSEPYLEDIKTGLGRNQLVFRSTSGIVAQDLAPYCHAHPDWTMGFLQSSRDLVMSVIFGNITQSQHSSYVFGNLGIKETLKYSYDNCASWTPSTDDHVFITKEKGRLVKTEDDTSAEAFLEELLNSGTRSPQSH